MMDNMTNVQMQELLRDLRANIISLVSDFEIETGLKVECVKPREAPVDDMTIDASFSVSSKT